MLKTSTIWLIIFGILGSVLLFGFLLPFLFSARSYEAACLGAVIVVAIIGGAATYVNKKLGKDQD